MESVDEVTLLADNLVGETLGDAQKAKSLKPQDRVTLGHTETAKVDLWLSQINSSSKGFLTLSRSDVVNFLIRLRKPEFIAKELSQLRADHYDPIKHIAWIAPQIKNAILSGDHIRVLELQTELQGVSLVKQKIEADFASPALPKKPRAPRKDDASKTTESEARPLSSEISRR